MTTFSLYFRPKQATTKDPWMYWWGREARSYGDVRGRLGNGWYRYASSHDLECLRHRGVQCAIDYSWDYRMLDELTERIVR